MFNRRFAATLGVLALVLAACAGDSGSSESAASEPAGSEPAATGDCIVGISWNNYQEERWALRDEPAIKAAIEAGGGVHLERRQVVRGAARPPTSRT